MGYWSHRDYVLGITSMISLLKINVLTFVTYVTKGDCSEIIKLLLLNNSNDWITMLLQSLENMLKWVGKEIGGFLNFKYVNSVILLILRNVCKISSHTD